MNDVFLFKRGDGSVVEVHAQCFLYAQKIAGEGAILIASGEDEVAEYDEAN